MPPPSLVLLRLLPQHLLSSMAGRAASLYLPRPLRRPVIGTFARAFGVDLAEVPGDLESYSSVQKFFTRPLPAGARAIDPRPDIVVSPCDGFWGTAGEIRNGTLLQVKKRSYSLAALLADEVAAGEFEGGAYATFYLSPRNYHRFHSPCRTHVVRLLYVPGTLWPVNRSGVEGVDSVFARNERLCAFMEIGSPPRQLCLVAVGATLVGKVHVNFDDLTTNTGHVMPAERRYGRDGCTLEKGEEWGRFEFGSTIVMLAAPGLMSLEAGAEGNEVRLGSRIGRLLAAGA